MSTEENKAVIRRILEEAFNKGNLAVADEVIAPNYIYHGAGGQDFKGVEGFKQFVAIMRHAFPDVRLTPEDMVAEGDKVAHCTRIRGTFKGEFMGMAPTGKTVDIAAFTLSRFAGGQEVEAWQYIDTLVFYQQMGITPPAK